MYACASRLGFTGVRRTRKNIYFCTLRTFVSLVKETGSRECHVSVTQRGPFVMWSCYMSQSPTLVYNLLISFPSGCLHTLVSW